ncbi:MAG: S-layer homology domain-containing protein [Candidatus Margulisiibacteriota bacterium]
MRKLLIFFLALFLVWHAAFAQTKVANDPTRIGVGARLLGMGKGYIGLADDLSGIFINPAALSNVTNWQITSMSGKFINEYEYLNLAAAYPTTYGVFGIGYVGSDIGFTGPAATTEVIDGIRIIPSTTEGVSYSFSNRVVLFSWGSELKSLLDWDVFEGLSAGATLKMFFLDMAGPGISNGTASGNEVDLGLHYRLTPGFKAGLVLQNALPFDSGGKIKWANGTEETLSSTFKAGLSLKLLGEEGWTKLGEQELSMNLDRDFFPHRNDIPQLWHFGLEWSPMEFIDLRTGIDQDIVGTGGAGQLEPTNNFTAGVGLYFGGFRFDYAFHQYNQITENNTHYFSLTYGVTKKRKPKVLVKMPSFSISPKDRSILYTEEVSIEGKVLNKKIRGVMLGDIEVALDENKFQIQFPLVLRKNSFLVEGFDNGNSIDSQKIRILRLKKFADVPAYYWASVPISILAMEKVVSGYPDGTFRPDGNITRAEMCTLLMKAKGIGDFKVKGKPFKDVKATHWAANYIGAAARQGIVKGYPDGTFRPKGLMTRAEGVVMIARFAQIPESRLLEVPFADVPGRHWAVKEISAAKEAGLLEYLADQPFETQKKLTRAEVAEMLSKTSFLADKVKDMLDWEKGY